MAKLKVEHFGPMENGCLKNNGYIEINKLTVFCGSQSTGKSTVAKLYSTIAWLEKAIIRNDFYAHEYELVDFVRLCSNQNIPKEYFTVKTFIHYYGYAIDFKVENSFLTIVLNDNISDYHRPQITYIPSERNVLSLLEDVDIKDNLSVMLHMLFDVIKEARKSFDSGKIELPVQGYIYYFDKNTKVEYISTDTGEKVKLSEASSGLQSIVPLSLAINYLTNEVNAPLFDKIYKLKNPNKKLFLSNIEDHYGSDADTILPFLNLLFLTGSPKAIPKNEVATIELFATQYLNSCLINIVEEPEQNLYPISQVNVVKMMLQSLNSLENNKLLITTHSPYILGAINNSLYASKLEGSVDVNELDSIISPLYRLNANRTNAYYFANGNIEDCMDRELGCIKNEVIDEASENINSIFDSLSELEKK